ncbi:MAG: hypothetical protein ABI772_09885 [Bacteroidota bacterium]
MEDGMQHIDTGLLHLLNGTWNTAGTVFNSTDLISGTDSYELVAGGCFLLHRVDVAIGNKKMEAIEIIGSESNNGVFSVYAFDCNHRIETMKITLEKENVFKISGDLVRAKLIIESDGMQMEATWEKSLDGYKWIPWMDVKFTKQQDQHLIANRW